MMHQFKFMHDMAEKKLLIGGSYEPVDCALKHKKDQGGVFLQITGACCLYRRRGDEPSSGQIDPGEEPVTEEKLLHARQL